MYRLSELFSSKGTACLRRSKDPREATQTREHQGSRPRKFQQFTGCKGFGWRLSTLESQMPRSTCSHYGSDLMKPLPQTPSQIIETPAIRLEPPSPTPSIQKIAGTPPRLPPLISNGTPLFAKGSINAWICSSPGHCSEIAEEETGEVERSSD